MTKVSELIRARLLAAERDVELLSALLGDAERIEGGAADPGDDEPEPEADGREDADGEHDAVAPARRPKAAAPSRNGHAPRGTGRTAKERIVELLRAEGPLTLKEVMGRLGLSKGTASPILSQREEFDKEEGYGKPYRLKEAAP